MSAPRFYCPATLPASGSFELPPDAAHHAKQVLRLRVDDAVQIFGGMGFMDECPVSRYYRDIRAATIGEGTTQIQRHVIARAMGLLG